MPARTLIIAAALLAASVAPTVSPAVAQQAPAERFDAPAPPPRTGGTLEGTATAPSTTVGEDDGFAFVPATGDHLKIDRRTGQVSLCGERNGRWTCTLVPDDRSAYEEEIERLQADKRRLEARVAELETSAGIAPKAEPWFGPDEEKELDRFLDFSGEAMRRFFGLVEELKQEYESPDRT